VELISLFPVKILSAHKGVRLQSISPLKCPKDIVGSHLRHQTLGRGMASRVLDAIGGAFGIGWWEKLVACPLLVENYFQPSARRPGHVLALEKFWRDFLWPYSSSHSLHSGLGLCCSNFFSCSGLWARDPGSMASFPEGTTIAPGRPTLWHRCYDGLVWTHRPKYKPYSYRNAICFIFRF